MFDICTSPKRMYNSEINFILNKLFYFNCTQQIEHAVNNFS